MAKNKAEAEVTEVEVKETEIKKPEIDEKEKKKLIKEEKKNSRKRSLFQRIMNVILWVIVIVWMLICIVDFINVHDRKEPKFTFSKSSITFDDENDTKGTATVYYGAGYKVFKYTKGSCKGALEFGPFWTKPRTGCR